MAVNIGNKPDLQRDEQKWEVRWQKGTQGEPRMNTLGEEDLEK